MAKTSQHVLPNPNGGWSVLKSGASRATKKFETQKEAIIYARQLSRTQGTELYVHKRDGTILSKDSYTLDRNSSRI